MRIVLLSGGSGKRLWPLSNNARSKQFLKVLQKKDGELMSMVQRVWEQLGKVSLTQSTLIATSKSQVDLIKNQIGLDAELIIEPIRRDTFPAISLAATYLYSEKGVNLDEVVAVLPVDPYVDDAFFDRVKDLESAINKSKTDLALIGVTPTYASSKYGYIIPDRNNNNEFLSVNRFIEKPIEEAAKELLNLGALWNCGVFAFKLEFLINLLKKKKLPLKYDDLLTQYSELPKISFDYEVVEKTNNIIVLPYRGTWKDLGTWNTLTEEMSTKQLGKGKITTDCENTHLINELDIPITVLGISNAIVAASPDGVLVANKESSHRIKEIIGELDNRPMYEERRWGWYRVLEHTKIGGNEVLTKRIGINAGCNLSYQYHFNRSEVWTIIKGEGVLAHNDKLSVVRPGDVLKINVGDKHALKAVTDLELIEVQTGSELIEEDIVRIFMTWEEVEENCYMLNK